ncbi:glycosyltransferase [bacterium]|nr:glycosyltransferase [bacterium]
MFGVRPEKFRHIFLATDPEVVHPRQNGKSNGKFLVHFHGEYAPFHGVKYILQAADLLRKENIQFQIIGTGITYDEDMQLAKKLELNNCQFIDRVPFEELADYMARADCCLGFFGDNPRTMRVFTNKVVEALAVGKPLISTKNQPVQELLTDGDSALLVEPANPAAIAEAVLRLRDDDALRKKVARNGRERFMENCTLAVFSKQLKKVIEEMLN